MHHMHNHIILSDLDTQGWSVDSVLNVKHKNLADPARGPEQPQKSAFELFYNTSHPKTHQKAAKHTILALRPLLRA
jgi:hypothetical protein